jgi:hypothetical protein
VMEAGTPLPWRMTLVNLSAENKALACLATNLLPALVVAMQSIMEEYANCPECGDRTEEYKLLYGCCKPKREFLARLCDLIEPELVRVEGRK